MELIINSQPVWFISYYFPKKSGMFDENSQMILDFKDKDPETFTHCTNLLIHWIENFLPFNQCHVCAIPSSRKSYTNAITLAAQEIAHRLDYVEDGTHFIKSVKSRSSFCNYGKRSPAVIIDSLLISDEIQGKNILLLDDVTSSGVTFNTVRSLILAKNAKSVCNLALAQTFPLI
jgi:hypothetical protein